MKPALTLGAALLGVAFLLTLHQALPQTDLTAAVKPPTITTTQKVPTAPITPSTNPALLPGYQPNLCLGNTPSHPPPHLFGIFF